MLGKHELDHEEERIRQAVRELSDEERKEYYQLLKPRLKDPDTYNALNYAAPLGLHHFYLGDVASGVFDLGLMGAGVAMLFTEFWTIGLGAIAAVILRELVNLVRGERIVQAYNNRVSWQTYAEVTGEDLDDDDFEDD